MLWWTGNKRNRLTTSRARRWWLLSRRVFMLKILTMLLSTILMRQQKLRIVTAISVSSSRSIAWVGPILSSRQQEQARRTSITTERASIKFPLQCRVGWLSDTEYRWKARTISSTTRLAASSKSRDERVITDSDQKRLNSRTRTEPPNDRAILLNQCLDAILQTPTVVSEGSNDDNIDQGRDLATDDSVPPPSQAIMEAALASLMDPSNGYDQRYGRPALRTYRAFIYPKQKEDDNSGNNNSNNNDNDNTHDPRLIAAAQRTANQIDFLIKRQTSQQNELVRNHDTDLEERPDNGNLHITRFPITLVLDNLRGAFNVGSIFRTAEACGVSKIITCGITPHPNGSGAEKLRKSALGADFLVPTQHYPTTRAALESLRQTITSCGEGDSSSSSSTSKLLPPFIVALETTEASQLYTSLDYRPYYYDDDDESNNPDDYQTEKKTNRSNSHRGIVLVLGNEVTGVDVELLDPLLKQARNYHKDSGLSLIDALVELPTHGQKNSLNVAAVAPVMLYEILRQWESTTKQ